MFSFVRVAMVMVSLHSYRNPKTSTVVKSWLNTQKSRLQQNAGLAKMFVGLISRGEPVTRETAKDIKELGIVAHAFKPSTQ